MTTDTPKAAPVRANDWKAVARSCLRECLDDIANQERDGGLMIGSRAANGLTRRFVERLDRFKDYRASSDIWETVVRAAANALDAALGDTDPAIDADATDEEVRDEHPVLWACQQLNALLTAAENDRTRGRVEVTESDLYWLKDSIGILRANGTETHAKRLAELMAKLEDARS